MRLGGEIMPRGQCSVSVRSSWRGFDETASKVQSHSRLACRELGPERSVQPRLAAGSETPGNVKAFALHGACDHIDHAAHRITPVQRGLRSFHDLDALDHRSGDARRIKLSGDAAGDRLPVQKHQHALGADPLHHHARTGWMTTEQLDSGLLDQYVRQIGSPAALDRLSTDHLGRNNDVLQPLLAAGCSHDHRIERKRQRRKGHVSNDDLTGAELHGRVDGAKSERANDNAIAARHQRRRTPFAAVVRGHAHRVARDQHDVSDNG